MEELIKQIMEIEEKAQSIVRDAKEASSELEARIARDAERISADIERHSQEKSESLKAKSDSDTEKKIAEIAEKSDKAAAALEEKLRVNGDMWAKTIADRVINA